MGGSLKRVGEDIWAAVLSAGEDICVAVLARRARIFVWQFERGG